MATHRFVFFRSFSSPTRFSLNSMEKPLSGTSETTPCQNIHPSGRCCFTAYQSQGASMLNSLKAWHDYFLQNRAASDAIPWNAPDTLTDEEKACIGKSIAAFQLGEYSEGKGLMKAAA